MEPSTVSSISEIDSKRRLLDACNVGDLKYLGEFIVGGGNLKEIVDENLQNCLHYCVKRLDQSQDQDPVSLDPFSTYDRLKCARVIIKADSELITKPDLEGLTSLHLAVLHGDLEFVKLLHEFNCDFSIPVGNNTIPASVRMSGRNCIHLAVINDQIPILKYLITINAKNFINLADDQGATPLHYAVQLEPQQSEEVIGILVEKGRANIDSVDSHGRTPLIWASTVGSNDAVRMLLKKGANLSIKDSYGLTALHCAASRGQLEIIQTILTWLCVANADDLEKMAGFRDIPDADGCSPLFYSVTMGHPKVTSCLLSYGSNVALSDSKGRTLCHCLARINIENQERKAKIISTQLRELLEYGMDPWRLNINGATALHEACLLRNVVLVEELTKLDRFQEFVNLPESLGHTPLHLVVAASWSIDPMGLKLCKLLLQNGADVNAITKLPNLNYVTALDLAKMNEVKVHGDKGELQKLLLRFGAKTYQELMAGTKVENSTESVEDSQILLHSTEIVGSKDTTTTTTTITAAATATTGTNTNITNDDYTDDNQNKRSPVPTDQTGIQVKPKYTESGVMVTKPKKQNPKPTRTYANKSSQGKVINNSNSCQTDRIRNCSEKGIQIDQPLRQNNQTNTSSIGSDSELSLINTLTNSQNNKIHGSRTSLTHEHKHSTTSQPNKPVKNSKSNNNNLDYSTKPPLSYKGQLPFSQTYLERELPKLLRQYLEKENQSYSILTGRHRMPKPTISPYLMPVVPGLQSSDYLNIIRGQRSAATRRPMKSHNPRTDANRQTDPDMSVSSMPPLKKSSAQSRNSKLPRQRSAYSQSLDRSDSIPRNVPGSRVRQSVADYEFYRFVDQLLKRDHMHNLNRSPDRTATKSAPKNRVKPTKHRTAMGGEISPPGRSDDVSDSDDLDQTKVLKHRPKSSKPRYYHKKM